MAELGTFKSELADISFEERIAKFERVQGDVKCLHLYVPDGGEVRTREKLQDVCPTEIYE